MRFCPRFFHSLFQTSSKSRSKRPRFFRLTVEQLEDRLLPSLGFDLAPLPAGTAGVPYSQDAYITPAGGSGNYSFTETGPLPAGMSFSPSGSQTASQLQLTGTPTLAGLFSFTVTATDTVSLQSVIQTFNLPINLGISPATNQLLPTGGGIYLPALPVNLPYSGTAFQATGGNSTDTYSFAETGALPPGMKLSSGVLSGTPSKGGIYPFTVTATDQNNPNLTGSQDYTLNIGLQLTPGTLAGAAVRTSYSQNLIASGGSGSYTFSISSWKNNQTGQSGSGTFDNLSLNSTNGNLFGTPTQAGTYAVSFTAKDNNFSNLSVTQSYTLNVSALNVYLPTVSSSITSGTMGSLTDSLQTWQPNQWQGLSVTLTSGPDLGETRPIKSNTAKTLTVSSPFTYHPAAGNTYTIDTLTLPAATFNPKAPTAYNQTIAAAGGSGPYKFSPASVDGVSLSTSGNLTGSPTAAGQYTFTVNVNDSTTPTANTGSQTFTLVVFPAPNPAPTSAGNLKLSPSSSPGVPVPLSATVNNAYTQSITVASGGNPGDTYLFSETGALPVGTSFQSSGTLSGTPTQPGSYNFIVVAVDNNNPSLTGSQEYTLTVQNANSVATTYTQPLYTTLAAASVGQTVSSTATNIQVASTSGFAPTNGKIEIAATLTAGNVFAGTFPGGFKYVQVAYTSAAQTGGGKYFFNGCTTTDGNTYTLGNGNYNEVYLGPLAPPPASKPQFPAPQTAPYSTISVASTSAFPSTGNLVVQTTAGNVELAYTGKTATSFTGVTEVTTPGGQKLNPNSLVSLYKPSTPLTLLPTILPNGSVSAPYQETGTSGNTYQITATGGTGPYTFSIPGSAPSNTVDGVTLSPSTGLFSGNPTYAGTFTFTVQVTDSSTPQKTASQQYSFTILPTTPLRNSPQQIAQAYGINNVIFSGGIKGDGTGQTVAILAGGDNPFFVSSTTASTTVTGFSTASINQMTTTSPGTIDVNSTTGFPSSGGVLVQVNVGTASNPNYQTTLVNYTSTSLGSFNGVTSLATAGTLYTGGAVGFNASDLHQFDSYFGLPDPPSFLKLNQYGTAPLPGPMTNAPTTSASGGSLAAKTYYYVITALTANGETTASNEVKITTTTSTSTVTLTWGVVSGATGYRVYRGTSSDGEGVYYSVSGGSTTSFTDTGATPTGNASPLFIDFTGETTQDIEWVHALAPGAKIVIFEGMPSNPSIALNYPGVTVVSNSYGGDNSEFAGETATDSQFLAPAGQNFTFVSSAGDNNQKYPPPGPNWPSATPYALAAGMTELATDAQGNYLGEAGNAMADFGASQYEPQPAYQQLAVNSTKRNTPDVSFVGEHTTTANSGTAAYDSSLLNINLKITGGSTGISSPWDADANGTSLAAPSWAALIAIANQGRALANEAALNGPTDTKPDLYNLPASDFNKITNLDNGSVSQGSSTYNQSGLGTPIANRLIAGLVGGHDTISGKVINSASSTGLAGWTVYLSNSATSTAPAPSEATTTTDANGFYSFLVAPGTYYVHVAPPPNWQLQSTSGTTNPVFNAGPDATAAAYFTYSIPPRTVGIYDPNNAVFHLTSILGNPGPSGDYAFFYGMKGWKPFAGDFTGNGKDTVGVFDPNNGIFHIVTSLPPQGAQATDNIAFQYGGNPWDPLAGNFFGANTDTVGVFDPTNAVFHLSNTIGNPGANDYAFQYGGNGWLPVVGDFFGLGHDTVGVYDPINAVFHLSNVLNNPGNVPGHSDYAFFYGSPGWFPLAGDFTGTGTDTVGLYDPTHGVFHLLTSLPAAGSHATDNIAFQYGGNPWGPVAGYWGALPQLAAGGEATVPSRAAPLTETQLQSEVQVALNLLASNGVGPALLARLGSLQFTVGPLPAGYLGLSNLATGRVEISGDAAGYGWFVDADPLHDPLFVNGMAQPGSAAANRMDLLTVVLHEMGHFDGWTELDPLAHPDALMALTLGTGEQRIQALDAVFAEGVG